MLAVIIVMSMLLVGCKEKEPNEERMGFTMGDYQYFHFKMADIVMVQVI
jgi:major membrane immunogen (membrane-anchored lipoprotein)